MGAEMIVQIAAINLTGTDPAKEGWHRETTPLLAYPPKGEPNILVIGAFSGQIAGILIEQHPDAHHYLIEPQDWACKQMAGKFGDMPNVHICQFALGDRSGVLQMGLYGTYDCTFMRGPTPLKDISGWGGYYDAEMVEFGEFMQRENLTSIYYATLNIEAYEYVLLPHMQRLGWLEKCQILGMSWHEAQFNSPAGGPYTYLGHPVPNYEDMQVVIRQTHDLVLSIDNWQTWVKR